MQKIIPSKIYLLFLLLALVNGYALINILTEGTYCQHFRINQTKSLPFYLFYASPFKNLEDKMYVSFKHSLLPQDLFKQVVGLPGDLITVNDQHVLINEIDYGFIQLETPSGRSLSPIEAGVIPQGYVFVRATHPLSFDSRYSEFGLVAVEQLKEQLWPIF